MSPVNFRKIHVPCRYFSNVPVDFKVVQCRLSNLRKRCVVLSILRSRAPVLTVCIQVVKGVGGIWVGGDCGSKPETTEARGIPLPPTFLLIFNSHI